MKVVLHNGARRIRGSETQAALIVEGLTERGHEVVVSCPPEGELAERMREGGVRVTGARPRGDLDPWNAGRFGLMLRRERAEAVLLTGWKRMPVAAGLAKLAGVPRVVCRLGLVRGLPRAWKYRVGFGRWVDAVFVNSRAVRDRWLETAPSFSPAEVHLIRNGVQPPPRPERLTLRAEIGAADDTPLACSLGGLEPRKGYDVLLEAAAACERTDLQVAVAGDGVERERLASMTRVLGLTGRVHWLGHRTDVANVLHSSDLFVLPSRNEGLSVALLEAMAAGLPSVVTDTGGAEDALAAREGRPPAGWIVPVGDAEALAGALETVVGGLDAAEGARADGRAVSPTLGGDVAARVGEARWRVANWFGVERMVEEVEAVLRGG